MPKYKFTNKTSTPVTVIGRRKIEIGGLVEGQEIEFSEKDVQKILPILKRKHFLKIEKIEEKKAAAESPAAAEETAAVSTLAATATAKTYRKRGRPAKSETAAVADVSDVAEA